MKRLSVSNTQKDFSNVEIYSNVTLGKKYLPSREEVFFVFLSGYEEYFSAIKSNDTVNWTGEHFCYKSLFIHNLSINLLPNSTNSSNSNNTRNFNISVWPYYIPVLENINTNQMILLQHSIMVLNFIVLIIYIINSMNEIRELKFAINIVNNLPSEVVPDRPFIKSLLKEHDLPWNKQYHDDGLFCVLFYNEKNAIIVNFL